MNYGSVLLSFKIFFIPFVGAFCSPISLKKFIQRLLEVFTLFWMKVFLMFLVFLIPSVQKVIKNLNWRSKKFIWITFQLVFNIPFKMRGTPEFMSE